MLELLKIRNLVLIEDASISFKPGFNVVTGETGAGKSVLMGSLELLLGRKASASLVRDGEASGFVEAVFVMGDDAAEALSGVYEQDDDEELLVLKRVIRSDGRSRAFINGSPTTIKAMGVVAARLINLTGQRETFNLLDERSHISYLDRYCDHSTALTVYRDGFRRYSALGQEAVRLQRQLTEVEDDMVFIKHQLDEIEEARLIPGEDLEIESEFNQLQNLDSLRDGFSAVSYELYNRNSSAYNIVSGLLNKLEGMSYRTADMEELLERLTSIQIEVRDIAETADSGRDSLSAEPWRLDELKARLDVINKLKYRHGVTVELILSKRDALQARLDSVDTDRVRLDDLQREHAALGAELTTAAKALSSTRRLKAESLSSEVERCFGVVMLSGAAFRIDIRQSSLGADGYDQVTFLVQTNPGEAFRAVGDVASGGELSRILLSIKKVMAEKQTAAGRAESSLYIFDEIDTGISQSVAVNVGELMADLAAGVQLITITHQPHIARYAGHHVLVEKSLSGDRALTTARALTADERIAEMSRMLGGEHSGMDTKAQARLILKPVHDERIK